MLEILGKVGFDWQVALVQLVNFLIVFFILKKLFFKPIQEAISKRKTVIDEGLDNADKAKAELVAAESKKDNLLKDAYQESQGIVGDAHEKKETIMSKAKRDAETEAEKIRETALSEAESIKEKVDGDLKERSIELVMLGLEKTLKKSMTKDQNDKLVKEFISKA
jgi:F-type H+-transporting ATPase subunit b